MLNGRIRQGILDLKPSGLVYVLIVEDMHHRVVESCDQDPQVAALEKPRATRAARPAQTHSTPDGR